MFDTAELDTFVSAEDAFFFNLEYQAGEMVVLEDSGDWSAAWAEMARTPEEAAEEAACAAELHRLQDLDAYRQQQAEENACTEEEFEDYDPEPPAAPAARRPERRSQVDGLTRTERQHLYVAAQYRVEQVGPIQFRAVNVPTGAEFQVTEVFGRFHRVISNTGGDHLLYLGECSCQHKQHGAAVCKHEAAAAAVEAFVAGDQPRQELRRQ